MNGYHFSCPDARLCKIECEYALFLRRHSVSITCISLLHEYDDFTALEIQH